MKGHVQNDTTNAIKKKRRKWSNAPPVYLIFDCDEVALLDNKEKQVVLSSVSESEVSSIKSTKSLDTPKTISQDNALQISVIAEYTKHFSSQTALGPGPGADWILGFIAGVKLKLSRYCESWLLPLASILRRNLSINLALSCSA